MCIRVSPKRTGLFRPAAGQKPRERGSTTPAPTPLVTKFLGLEPKKKKTRPPKRAWNPTVYTAGAVLLLSLFLLLFARKNYEIPAGIARIEFVLIDKDSGVDNLFSDKPYTLPAKRN